jgi:hypothetical protein
MIIEETEKTSELKKVEDTVTVEKIQCDVCGHAVDSNDWNGHEFSVNPSIDREVHGIRELDDIFTAYHTEIPRHIVDDGYDGTEMNFDVPEKPFFKVLAEELPILRDVQDGSTSTRIAKAGLKQEYEEKIGTSNFYLLDDSIHHFMYKLQIDESADDHKHICDDCYEVLFD